MYTTPPTQKDQPPPPQLPASSALFLDFDGTLAPIAETPARVKVHDGVPGVLEAVQKRLDGAVAVITGRRLSEVDHHLAPFLFVGAGLHGAELRDAAGGQTRLQWNPSTRDLVAALTRRFGTDPRVVIEDKDAAVALHYRQAPSRAQECRDVMMSLVRGGEFELIHGSMVVEARPRGSSKGRALRSLLALERFRDRTPVFVGDDVTDEDAFTAAAEYGGYGVKVGPGPTVARYRLPRCEGVVDWLKASLGGP